MGFDKEGFLGSESLSLVAKQLSEFQDLFEFAYSCSASAMECLSKPLPQGNAGVSIGVMCSRCVAQYQGSIILAERGLTLESMILARALFETVFVLGALINKKVSPEDLAESDLGSRRKLGNAIMQYTKNISTEQNEKLASFIKEQKTAKTISMEQMATHAGMKNVYDGIYRHLSHFVAHPTLTSASAYYAELSEGSGKVLFKPLSNYTSKAILSASIGILLACSTIEKNSSKEQNINLRLNELLDKEDILYEKYKPFQE